MHDEIIMRMGTVPRHTEGHTGQIHTASSPQAKPVMEMQDVSTILLSLNCTRYTQIMLTIF